jgi:hypothetical protein
MTDEEKKLVEAYKKRFDEHLQREYPNITQFKEGEYTRNLSESIPLDYLKNLVKHYRLFASVMDKKPKNPKRDIGKKSYDPLIFPSEIHEIKTILEGLEKEKWLQVTDVPEIINFIIGKMFVSPKGYERKVEGTKYRFKNEHGGQWEKNISLKFLILFLVEYMKEVKGTPSYRIIEKFLVEQEIGSSLTYNDIQKIYARIRINRLWWLYSNLVINFESKWFDDMFQDIPEHLRADFCKSCLPEFVDFFPPSWKKRNLPE